MSEHLVDCPDCADSPEGSDCPWCGGYRAIPCEQPWCECRNNMEEPDEQRPE